MCEWWVGDWTNCNILTPSSFVFSSTSFSFCWVAQSGVLRAHSPPLGASSLYSILSPTRLTPNSLNLSVAPGYIIICRPPASCGRHICTQFNHSHGYTLIYSTGCTCYLHRGISFWQFGRGSICYTTPSVIAYSTRRRQKDTNFPGQPLLFLALNSVIIFLLGIVGV